MINGTTIGATTASTGAFTALSATQDASMHGLTVGRGAGSISTNTATGNNALSSNTTGGSNTATGFQALNSNTTGLSNTAIGRDALQNNTTGTNNTATGRRALRFNTTGNDNTASGVDAGREITTGSGNTILGQGLLGTAALTNTVLIGAGGTERLRIDSTGRVGINTSSLTDRLSVNGSTRLDGLLTVGPVGNEGGEIELLAADGTVGWIFDVSSANSARIFTVGKPNTDLDLGQRASGTGKIKFITNSVERMRITDSGNVGIGMSSPARALHVSDVMRLQPRATEPGSPAAGDIYFDSATNKLRCYDGTAWQDLF
jgi:hypothetical protein